MTEASDAGAGLAEPPGRGAGLKVALLTREYPPEVYGGAGVHVEYLARALSSHVEVGVHCFGGPREDPLVVRAYQPWEALAGPAPHAAALETVSVDVAMAGRLGGVDLVHSHTWYTNFGGHLAKLVYDLPHVMTTHSLEPLRPWKVEQLGGGYAVSSFCERTAIESADAVIAVSNAMRDDVLACYPAAEAERVTVIHNGIDADTYRPDHGTDVLERVGIDPDRPSVVFLGRITRQKGLPHLLDAAHRISSDAQLVLLAGAPDTPEIAEEVQAHVARLREGRGRVIWIERMLGRPNVVQILTNASVFVCPSIYEPFGLVNLEAMACEAPVVATATGGIPEIVVEGGTGHLVPFEPDPQTGAPRDAQRFAGDMAERINALLADPDRARKMGRAGRQRVLEHFTWSRVAERTVELYRSLV